MKRQRRERVRSRAVWRDPLLRARRAIRSAIRRIETSGRLIDAALRFQPDRPLEQVRQLDRLSGGIGNAEQRLLQARDCAEESLREMEQLREDDGTFVPLLLDTAFRYQEAAARLDQLFRRVVEASAQIVEETPTRKASPRHPRVVLVIAPRLPAACTTVADAARKISRGRAPPLSPTARSIQ